MIRMVANFSKPIISRHSIPSRFSLQSFRGLSVSTEKLESLGDCITSSAVLVSWAKEPGQPVHEDDVVAVVETDKVTMDIKAKKSGIFVEGFVAIGGEINVGATLYKIDTSKTATAAKSGPPQRVEVPVRVTTFQECDTH